MRRSRAGAERTEPLDAAPSLDAGSLGAGARKSTTPPDALAPESAAGLEAVATPSLGRGHESRRAKPLERGRQVTRIFKLKAALGAAKAGLTASQLLEILEQSCSRRTLYRDLAHLQDAGYPLTNQGGVWSVAGQPRGDAPPFTVDEALSLSVLEQLLEPMQRSWLGGPLAEARAKVVAGLSPEARALVGELSETAATKLLAPPDYTDKAAVLDTIHDALHREHAIRITHVSPGRPAKTREVEPYALWYVAGRAYLIGRCRSAEELRTFAVARIEEATLLDETFDRDPSFDLESFAAQSFGVYQGEVHTIELEFAPSVAHLPEERRFHPTQRHTPLPNGGLRLSFDAAGLPEIAAWVASFGGKVRVTSPQSLRNAVCEIHREGLRANDPDLQEESGERSVLR